MDILRPREKFLADPIAVKRYREFVDDPIIQSAVQGVMIEFMRSNPTQEATRGANHFLQTFLGYAEKQPVAKQWPNHGTLNHPENPERPAARKEK